MEEALPLAQSREFEQTDINVRRHCRHADCLVLGVTAHPISTERRQNAVAPVTESEIPGIRRILGAVR